MKKLNSGVKHSAVVHLRTLKVGYEDTFTLCEHNILEKRHIVLFHPYDLTPAPDKEMITCAACIGTLSLK